MENTHIAVLRSKVGEAKFEIPSVGGGEPFVIHFNKKNNFTVEVNKVITYKNSFGGVHVLHENYPQHLLNAYPDIVELVEIKKVEVFNTPVFVDKSKPVDTVKPEEKEPENLEELTVPKLVALAGKLGIEIKQGTSKPDIIAMINQFKQVK